MDYTTQKASLVYAFFFWQWERVEITVLNTVLSHCDWDVLSLTCRYDKVRKPQGLSIKHGANPRRNTFITLCSLGAFLKRKKWIIHERRGLVSVVNSVGFHRCQWSRLFLAQVWQTGTQSWVTWVPLTFHLVISFFFTGIPVISIFLLYSFTNVTDSLPFYFSQWEISQLHTLWQSRLFC